MSEAEGLLNTRLVFDGQVLEVFQGGRSIARAPIADIAEVQLDEGKRLTLKIETTSGTLLTDERRPFPLAFEGAAADAARALAAEVNAAVGAGSASPA